MQANIGKIKNFIKNPSIIHSVIIIFLIFILTFFLGNHHVSVFSDRGRELLIPQEILNGQVPYKDITLIYFPLGFYINALIYKIFGVSLNTLLISQMFLSIVYMLGFYYLSKEFLDKTTSFLLTILIVVSCIFARNDLFSFIFPYSFSRTYGILASFLCLFCFVKLFKTDNLKYLYIASCAAGFAICCKLEFFMTAILFCTGLFLYKKLQLKQYIKIFSIGLIFPILTCGSLVYQGVTFQNIIDAAKFGIDFSKTQVMTEFLAMAGLYPFNFIETLSTAMTNLPTIFMIIFLVFMALKFHNIYQKKYFIPCFTIIILYYYYNHESIYYYWILLPYVILLTAIHMFICKKYQEGNKTIFFLIIATLLLGQREFFRLALNYYGTYSFPLYILSLIVLIREYIPKKFLEVEIKNTVNFLLVLLIFMFMGNLCQFKENSGYLLRTEKGNIYTKYHFASVIHKTLDYISQNIDENNTILVLPEGNLINFLTNRKVDMHCFMMDRLYHDAYGDEKARDMIAGVNSDYILLLKGFDLNNFHNPYLYNVSSSLLWQYITRHYNVIKEFKGYKINVKILKKSVKVKNINVEQLIEEQNKEAEKEDLFDTY